MAMFAAIKTNPRGVQAFKCRAADFNCSQAPTVTFQSLQLLFIYANFVFAFMHQGLEAW